MAFRVSAWAAWSEAGGASGFAEQEAARDRPSPPSLLRRRVSTLGQQALLYAWNLQASKHARLIASSRHGEFRRSLGIMEGLVAGEGVSPADFTLSVHHALVGLLSIAQANRRGHTALAAGPESFCFGFLEAISSLAESPHEQVVLIHYDEPLPDPFAHFANETGAAMTLALALDVAGPGEAMTLAVAPTVGHRGQPPADVAQEFCAFLSQADRPTFTFVGPRMTWQWVRDAAPH